MDRLPQTFEVSHTSEVLLLSHQLQGKEGGLNLRYFAPLQTAETYLHFQILTGSWVKEP